MTYPCQVKPAPAVVPPAGDVATAMPVVAPEMDTVPLAHWPAANAEPPMFPVVPLNGVIPAKVVPLSWICPLDPLKVAMCPVMVPLFGPVVMPAPEPASDFRPLN